MGIEIVYSPSERICYLGVRELEDMARFSHVRLDNAMMRLGGFRSISIAKMHIDLFDTDQNVTILQLLFRTLVQYSPVSCLEVALGLP